MFFLATADEHGMPQCSYKGGDPGFVRVVDERTLAFPNYDGNGMYLSIGNLLATRRSGLLFIDFATPEAAAGERHRVDRRGRSAARGVPRGAVRRAGARDARAAELPALRAPDGARRALAVRPARRLRDTGAGLEAARRGRTTCCPTGIRPGRKGCSPTSWTLCRWLVERVSKALPITHGAEAAREIVGGSSIADVAGLLGAEALVGTVYAVIGLALLRRFEVIARRHATLEVA